MRIINSRIKRFLFTVHKLFIRLGIHIIPVHFHSPVPNVVELDKTRELWARKSSLPGVSIDLDRQEENMRNICKPFQSEYVDNEIYLESKINQFGPGFGYIEAQALHSIIRHYKPKQIVEVGCGESTFCMLKASEINENESGHRTEIVSIEPYPSERLKKLKQIELISQPVQMVPLDVFTKLNKGDLLFIDSTHTVKVGGDVNYLILEVLPRLQQGVIVHLHDIYLPYDYQPSVLRTFYHWAETSLLHAFLIFNNRVDIIFCLTQFHHERKDVLKEVFPNYRPQKDLHGIRDEQYKAFEQNPDHFPTSIYIQIL